MIEIQTSDEHVKVIKYGITLASFECVDRIDGAIEEFDNDRLSASELIAVAQWLLEVAARRAYDEESR